MTAQAHTVGVIIAAYNAADTIARAISSALAEPQAGEVWVVDDASSDATVEQALAADDGSGRLHVLSQAENAGPAAARNRALARIGAPWVCVLDADDFFLPGRLGWLAAMSDDWDMVADDLIRIRGDEAPPPPPRSPVPVGPISFVAFIEGNITRSGQNRQELGFMKPLMRREFLQAHDLSYDQGLRLGEDYHLYARMLALGARLCRVGPAGYVAVERAESLSSRHSIEDLAALRECDAELARIRALRPHELKALRAHYVSIDKRLQWRRLIEAVKSRNPRMAMSAFTSGPVAAHLTGQLLGQVWIRGRRLFVRRGARQPLTPKA